jgi:hypothetical protein
MHLKVLQFDLIDNRRNCNSIVAHPPLGGVDAFVNVCRRDVQLAKTVDTALFNRTGCHPPSGTHYRDQV